MSANQELIPASPGAPPNATPLAVVGVALANDRHEKFAHAIAAGATCAAAARIAGYAWAASTINSHAGALRARPDIRKRINELLAPQVAAIDKGAHLLMLETIATADATEISYVVTKPCPLCWSAEAMRSAVEAALQAHKLMPDLTQPEEKCTACEGYGVTRTVIRPTSEWSPAARMLFESASTDRYGVTTVKLKDQAKYSAMLAERMPGWRAPERSVNLNANVAVDVPANMSTDDCLAWLANLNAGPEYGPELPVALTLGSDAKTRGGG